MLLPTIVPQLVPDVSMHSVGTVFDLFVDVTLTVMAEHVNVEAIFGVLIADSCLFEVVFIVRFRIMKPIAESVVD